MSVDQDEMVYTIIVYLALASVMWLLFHLIQLYSRLPSRLNRQIEAQRVLLKKVEGYKRYIQERKAREAAGETVPESSRSSEEWHKEQLEWLGVMKRELQRISGDDDPDDLSHLLDEEEKRLLQEREEHAIAAAAEESKPDEQLAAQQ